jgi:hypothetical protein
VFLSEVTNIRHPDRTLSECNESKGKWSRGRHRIVLVVFAVVIVFAVVVVFLVVIPEGDLLFV